MKIIYVANIRFPTEKAHGIQIAKMCEAFASLGHEVELVVPKRFNALKDDPFEYYLIEKNFSVRKVFSLDLIFLGRIGFLIQSLTFALFSVLHVMRRKADIIYSRDDILLYFLGSAHGTRVYEVHTPRFNMFTRKALEESDTIIAITGGLKAFYVDKGVSDKKIIISPDGVDLALFTENLPSKEKSRELLNIPKDKKVVTYTGSLYGWKGAHVLADATRHFDDENLMFLFVGGTKKDVKRFRLKYRDESVQIRGMQPYDAMPLYVRAADVLVVPNSGESPVSARYTSPMKLFEYMAGEAPIVASDLPSMREILDEETAVFVRPDDARALAEGINTLLDDTTRSKELGSHASERVKNYTWKKRAEGIIGYIRG